MGNRRIDAPGSRLTKIITSFRTYVDVIKAFDISQSIKTAGKNGGVQYCVADLERYFPQWVRGQSVAFRPLWCSLYVPGGQGTAMGGSTARGQKCPTSQTQKVCTREPDNRTFHAKP